jgi:periplasmic protein CpxP/Spy
MNKVNLLSFFCVVLLLTNLGLIWFVISHKPGEHKKEGPKKIVIEKLSFDENQIKAYDKLIDWHRTEIKKSDKKMLELKNQLYATMLTEGTFNTKDSLINEIGTLQITIEQIHYKHFKDIKQLCKPEQLKAFEKFSTEITNLFPSVTNH